MCWLYLALEVLKGVSSLFSDVLYSDFFYSLFCFQYLSLERTCWCPGNGQRVTGKYCYDEYECLHLSLRCLNLELDIYVFINAILTLLCTHSKYKLFLVWDLVNPCNLSKDNFYEYFFLFKNIFHLAEC